MAACRLGPIFALLERLTLGKLNYTQLLRAPSALLNAFRGFAFVFAQVARRMASPCELSLDDSFRQYYPLSFPVSFVRRLCGAHFHLLFTFSSFVHSLTFAIHAQGMVGKSINMLMFCL